MVVFNKYDYYTNLFCNYGPYIRNGEYYRLITSMFVHGDIFHLGFNMYALYVIGKQVESYFGKFKYCGYY